LLFFFSHGSGVWTQCFALAKLYHFCQAVLDKKKAMSRASWLIGTDPAKRRQGSAMLPCKKNRTHWPSQDRLY
jgi:hypothetical protein